jgi:hypothetical protein
MYVYTYTHEHNFIVSSSPVNTVFTCNVMLSLSSVPFAATFGVARSASLNPVTIRAHHNALTLNGLFPLPIRSSVNELVQPN